jgi:hypothetical protein
MKHVEISSQKARAVFEKWGYTDDNCFRDARRFTSLLLKTGAVLYRRIVDGHVKYFVSGYSYDGRDVDMVL